MRAYRPITEQLLREFEPQQSWLMHDSHVHGVEHMARVFILQELICQKLEVQDIKLNRDALRWAAMTHDVGRVDDGIDIYHGRRSSKWIEENLSAQMSPEMLDTVTYIVHWHVPSDADAPVMTIELQVLKDADALDRVRLGDLDIRYLRTEAAQSLVPVAEELFGSYENIMSDDRFDAVVKSAQSIGVLETKYESELP